MAPTTDTIPRLDVGPTLRACAAASKSLPLATARVGLAAAREELLASWKAPLEQLRRVLAEQQKQQRELLTLGTTANVVAAQQRKLITGLSAAFAGQQFQGLRQQAAAAAFAPSIAVLSKSYTLPPGLLLSESEHGEELDEMTARSRSGL